MTTGNELSKSDVFVKLAVMLSPLVREADRQGTAMKELERGLLGGLLSTGRQVIDLFLIAQGDGAPGETTVRPPTVTMTKRPSLERSTEALNCLPECCETFLSHMSFPHTCIAKEKIAAVRSCEDQCHSTGI